MPNFHIRCRQCSQGYIGKTTRFHFDHIQKHLRPSINSATNRALQTVQQAVLQKALQTLLLNKNIKPHFINDRDFLTSVLHRTENIKNIKNH
jgi:hypothetical protein